MFKPPLMIYRIYTRLGDPPPYIEFALICDEVEKSDRESLRDKIRKSRAEQIES